MNTIYSDGVRENRTPRVFSSRGYLASGRWRRNVALFTFLLLSGLSLSLVRSLADLGTTGLLALYIGIGAASLLWGGVAATVIERLKQLPTGAATGQERAAAFSYRSVAHISAMERWQRSLRRKWQKAWVRAGVSAAVIAVGSAFLMFTLEHSTNDLYSSPWDSMWWSLVTITTTGYGDIVPKTFAGRVLGVFAMFSGLGLLSVITALIASAFVTESLKEARGLEAIKGSGHLLLAGWNAGAEQVIEGLVALYGLGNIRIVLVNQLPEEAVNEVLYKYRELELRFVRGDYTQESVLERTNIRGATAAIILADTSGGPSARVDERTVLACLAMKHLNPEVKVTGELLDPQNEVHLRRANVDEVVISGEFNAFLLSTSTGAPGIPQAVRDLLSANSPTQLRRIEIPDRFVGRSFGELAARLREEEGLLSIGIVTEARALTLANVLSADYTSVDDFIQRKFDEAGIDFGSFSQIGVQLNPPDSYVISRNDWVIVL